MLTVWPQECLHGNLALCLSLCSRPAGFSLPWSVPFAHRVDDSPIYKSSFVEKKVTGSWKISHRDISSVVLLNISAANAHYNLRYFRLEIISDTNSEAKDMRGVMSSFKIKRK